MKVVVATHGHCFDGLASAVVFTQLLRRLEGQDTEFEYRGCGYGVGQQLVSEAVLSGDQNAILDYRFHASDRVTWYFDHHPTAFGSDADKAWFDARQSGRSYFFDPSYSSCTRLIADLARTHFASPAQGLDELIRWADRIDSARFDSAAEAIDRSDPIMRLVAVVEQYGDDHFLRSLVPQLLTQPLSVVAEQTKISRMYRPIGRRLERFIQRVTARAQTHGNTVFVDLSDEISGAIGKFVTYALYPRLHYSVLLIRLKHGIKISVGHNPWSGATLQHDISQLCARHGGGGHRYVGGISLPLDDLPRAQSIALELTRELQGATVGS